MNKPRHEVQVQDDSHPLPHQEAQSRYERLLTPTKALSNVNVPGLAMLFVVFADQVQQQAGIPVDGYRFYFTW